LEVRMRNSSLTASPRPHGHLPDLTPQVSRRTTPPSTRKSKSVSSARTHPPFSLLTACFLQTAQLKNSSLAPPDLYVHPI
jgi:hypothetical protein